MGSSSNLSPGANPDAAVSSDTLPNQKCAET